MCGLFYLKIVEENIYIHLLSISKIKPYLLASKVDILFEVNEKFGVIIGYNQFVRNNEVDVDLELEFEEEQELSMLDRQELLSLPPLQEAKSVLGN